MEKLSPKKKLSAVRLYLSGLSYDEIAAKCGVSKGTVANVVADLKAGVFPEAADAGEHIETLRELSLDLKQSGLSPGKCAVGVAVLNRIKASGLDAADIDRWPIILKAVGNEEDAKGFVATVYGIQEALAKTGMSLEDADEKVQKLEAKAADLAPLTKQVEERRKQLSELTKRRDDLNSSVNALDQKYALLNPRVTGLEKREGELSHRIKEQEGIVEKAEATLATLVKEKKRLVKAGFTLDTLAEFNDRARAVAAQHDIATAVLRARLFHELQTLDKGLGLETLVEHLKSEMKEQKQACASLSKSEVALKAAISALEQQKAALEASIKATRENVNDEMAKVVPATRAVFAAFTQELQLGNKAMLDDLQHLRDEALAVGRELGRYDHILETTEWLTDLLSLASGQDNLEPHRVRVIMLRVLTGARSWMKGNPGKTKVTVSTYSLETLIGELERWTV